MLSLSNLDVAETLRAFSDAGVDCTFIVPTPTGLQKSILDATDTVRVWLRENGLHDYAAQKQGPDHKVQIETLLISQGQTVETVASLYRPETKGGDPRIWFGRLGQYAEPTDLLAICKAGRRLVVVNCSRSDLNRLLGDRGSVFWRAYSAANSQARQVSEISKVEIAELLRDKSAFTSVPETASRPRADADLDVATRTVNPPLQTVRIGNADLTVEALELLALLKGIGSAGYHLTRRSGDTGVGYTLEELLGIKCNSSKAPDYKGIEIKAGRAASHVSGRTTILSQVPDWSISRLKGTADILRTRGRFHEEKQRMQLFHEMAATKVNSYGLSLKVDHKNEMLHQTCIETEGTEPVIDVTWRLAKLFERLIEKHKQTFWVKADTVGKGAGEQFLYSKARYTSGVSPSKFPMLLEAGVISLDYTMKQLPNGQAKDQGYLFKIRQADLPLLFRSPQEFDLTK